MSEIDREIEAVRRAAASGEIPATPPQPERSVAHYLGRRLLRAFLIWMALIIAVVLFALLAK